MRHIKSLSTMQFHPVLGQDETDGKTTKDVSQLQAGDITFVVALLRAVESKKERAAEAE